MARFYRSVWISDLHLCSRDARADLIHDFLANIKCDYLYLVGDIIDVWALRKKWYWPAIYNEVVHKLLKRSRKGAKITFIPGNHDEFFRQFVGLKFGDVRIAMNAIHETADGRRLLVLHGDEFDAAVQGHRWLAHLGDWAYRHLIIINRVYNALRGWCGKPYWSLSGAIKRRVKQAVKYLNNFESILTAEARRRKVDGVVCGHIHQPALRQLGDLLYCNTGDWIEHCTALVEHMDGRLELVWWHHQVDERSRDHEAEAAANRFAPARLPSPNRLCGMEGESLFADWDSEVGNSPATYFSGSFNSNVTDTLAVTEICPSAIVPSIEGSSPDDAS